MNLVKTQLNTYLKNSNVTEFNYGDGEFYVVKELTKNLVTVYHTNDTLMGNLNNVGIYDRRKEGFVLINCGYMFNQMVKPYKTGEPIPDNSKYEDLEKKAKELYPDCKVLFRWNTRDCISLDKIPYIGEFSNLMENMYIGTGF